MKVKSLEEFDAVIVEIIRRKMASNIEAMKEHGMSDDDISEAMPTLIEQCEQARNEAMMNVQSMLCDDDGRELPSYSVN